MCGRFACSCAIQPGQNVSIHLAAGGSIVPTSSAGNIADAANADPSESKSNSGNDMFSLYADCSQFQRDWRPSFNICPTVFAPALVMDKHSKIQLVPMRFGMIPSWYGGKLEDFKLTTINARGEEMMTKKTFQGPMRNGQRCVIPVDGFYEWQKQSLSKLKQPYFFYLKENHDLMTQANNSVDEYSSKVVMMGMAAVYDSWTNPETLDTIRGFSIITVQSSKDMNWLHHREPVILENADEVLQWLDSQQYPLEKALKLIKSRDGVLGCHPADSHLVNYPGQHKSIDCITPHEDESNKKPDKLGAVPKGQPRIDAFFQQKRTPLKAESSYTTPKVKQESAVKKADDDDDAEKKSDYDAGDYAHDDVDDDKEDDIVEVGRIDNKKRSSVEAFGDDKGVKSESGKVPKSEAKKPKNSA